MHASLSREVRSAIGPVLIAALLCCGLAACSGAEQASEETSSETENADASGAPEVPFPTAASAPPPAGLDPWQKAAAERAAAAPSAGAASSADATAGEDYYTKRASETLKAARTSLETPHPLAAAHPGYFVTVCEAGCTDERAPEIAGMERKVTQQTVRQGMMVPTSSGEQPAAAPPQASILCIGGCFDRPKSFPARAVPERVGAAAKAADARVPAKRDPLSPVR